MKKIIIKSLALCIILIGVQLNQVNAQVKLSISSVKFEKDTATFGSINRLSVAVKNTGTQAFSGKIYVDYKTSYSTGGSNPMVLDSTAAISSFKVQDTVNLSRADHIIEQQSYNKGPNIVVVWPRATGVTTVDSASTGVYVLSPSGIREVQKSENDFILYPNPTNSRLYILPIDSKINIENVRIYSAIGTLIRTMKSINNLVDISGLEHGLYFLEIETNLNQRISKRFVME